MRLAALTLAALLLLAAPASARPWLTWDRASVHLKRNVRAVERTYNLTVGDEQCARVSRTAVGCFVAYYKDTPETLAFKVDYVEARLRSGRVVVIDSYRTNTR